MIKHFHVIECDSTQDLVKEQLQQETESRILVSCENQTAGRGRGQNKWQALPGTICFSMNIAPHKVMSYTALELSVIIAMFFESKGRTIKLKWPNDLWDVQERKCGGILVQGSQNHLIAGLGLNLYSEDDQYGGIFSEPFDIDKKNWARELADYIHQNRFQETSALRREWLKRCGHLNQMVRVTEGEKVVEGIFQGLGDHGEAEICRDTRITRIFNGSLRLSSQA